MHGVKNMKVTDAQPIRISHHYKNTKEKLLKTKTAVWFNIMFRSQHLTPE